MRLRKQRASVPRTSRRKSECHRRLLAALVTLGIGLTIFFHNTTLQATAARDIFTDYPANQTSTSSPGVHYQKRDDFPRIAFYMTTHLSQQHVDYLTHCWPGLTQRLKLLQKSDLILYTSQEITGNWLESLHFRNITLRRPNHAEISTNAKQQKQQGAIQALLDPFRDDNRWFEGYDWVFRLNPDVLVRNDTWFFQAVQTSTYSIMYIDCMAQHSWHTPVLHTDFSVFRPAAINQTKLFQQLQGGAATTAEQHYTNVVRDELDQGRAVPIPGALAFHTFCRVMGPQSPVIHVHDDQILQACKANQLFNFHGNVIVDAYELPPSRLGQV